MFIYNGIMLYVQIQAVNYASQFIKYYVHQYNIYIFKKLMKSFQHKLFISLSYPQGNILFIIHPCILLNLHVIPPLPEQIDCLILQEFLQCSPKSLSMEKQCFCTYSQFCIVSLLFCIYIYIVEVMCMYKQYSTILGWFLSI